MNLPITFKNDCPQAYTLTAFVSPVQVALKFMREFNYAEAAKVLIAEYRKDLSKFELGRIGNLIEIGCITEAIEALHQQSGIEDYNQNKPADDL